jgi:ATP-dependent exoDNAse (exonuclease V) beta subunit
MSIENKFTIQKSFVINAGAGSGKTYALSRRYINALLGFDFFIENDTQKQYYENLKPATVKEVVTLTYTEAAAIEMRERIFSLIKKVLNFNELNKNDADYNSIETSLKFLNDEQKNYVKNKLNIAIQEISDSNISTIHSYCLNIIKKNSDIARVDSGIELIKDNEKINLIENVIFDVFNNESNKDDVIELSKYVSLFKINKFINKYLNDSNFRDNFKEFSSQKEVLYKELLLDMATPQGVDDSFNFVIDFLEKNSDKFEEKSLDVNTYIGFLKKYKENFLNFELKNWTDLSKDFDISFAFNRVPFTKLKEIKPYIDNIKKLEDKDSFTMIDLEKEKIFFKTIDILKNILEQIKNKYDDELIGIKKVDFDSIIYIASKIIEKVNTDFKYFMVDEFQDTNEVQFNIIKNSLNENTNFFVVGDSKQSIYSFQGAEIEVFNDSIKDNKLFTKIVDMDINFRSDGNILDYVNNIFSFLFTKDENIKLIKQNYEAKHQNLKISSKNKENSGSFDFLMTTDRDFEGNLQDNEKPESRTIALFIKSIVDNNNSKYYHINKLINNQKKAIAVVFDSKAEMLYLKKELNKYGIEAKVSATENFYYTMEVNDIFNVLKAINIVSYMKYKNSKNEIINLNPTQKFYLVGAYRSNILRFKDKDIKKYIDNNEIPEKLNEYLDKSKELTLSKLIKFIYDDSKVLDVYAYFSDIEQRIANLNKFLNLSIEFETNDKNELGYFLNILEEAIYFNQVNEDEAFYKSSNVESIELCTIHSTKGLSYPMIILAKSEKELASQPSHDVIKHNKLTLANGENLVLLGYNIDKYTPISSRILSIFNKIKHMAEKKRLLYVALTRAEHDIVISGFLKDKTEIKTNSYLYMLINSLNIEKNDLYEKNIGISLSNISVIEVPPQKIEQIDFELELLEFKSNIKVSATMNNTEVFDVKKTEYGTLIHKILEENWKNFNKMSNEDILSKYDIDASNINKFKISLDKFKNSDVYLKIKNNKNVYFELGFENNEQKGFIDLLFFDGNKNGWVIIDFKTGIFSKEKEDKYLEQLEFYKEFLEKNGKNVIEMRLLWL